jgi:hypothetical protein
MIQNVDIPVVKRAIFNLILFFISIVEIIII